MIAGLLVLTPLLGWAGSLGFAPAVALAGLLTVSSLRVRTEDRALLLALFTALVWACASVFWSPWRPGDLEEQTGLKLVFMLALYGCAVSAARAVPEVRLPGLIKGLVAATLILALILLLEAATAAAGYKILLGLIGQTVRPDYAIKNVAQGLYVLTLLAPMAIAAVTGRARWVLGLGLEPFQDLRRLGPAALHHCQPQQVHRHPLGGGLRAQQFQGGVEMGQGTGYVGGLALGIQRHA